MLPTGPP